VVKLSLCARWAHEPRQIHHHSRSNWRLNSQNLHFPFQIPLPSFFTQLLIALIKRSITSKTNPITLSSLTLVKLDYWPHPLNNSTHSGGASSIFWTGSYLLLY
jgi:hypothetical protein